MTQTTRIALQARPKGEPADSDFRIEQAELGQPGEDQALLQTLFLSLDPYMRGRMSDAPSYAAPVQIGQTMVGATVSRVLESPGGQFAPGDVVLGYGGWQSHSVEPVSYLRKVDTSTAPVSTALGVLGMPGFTAYAGLLQIGKPQPGETVVVAAASGPVGSAVGQIAKLRGARAVAIAGGQAKVDYCREIGFDAAVDHRSENFRDDLAAATPDGIDVYFENVGGAVWDAVLPRLNTYARVPLCGLVSVYNATSLPEGPDRSGVLMGTILRKSLTVRGFIQTEFVADHFADFQREMSGWVSSGQVKYREDVVDGLDNTPEAFRGLLAGRNFGKLVVKVSE
ncbi:NADP-dependent oxidoreductase [Allobranchiibius sp. GilTou73]|uniref:NADP-dependent oxidoreductase n=1 Tax=Allobranchiibius sp. GilTou73 TaxID=2904523 RepID=UPI001F306230|nr:NADP-dependent oxidoreductase [Allobranchiibius sp. GilTou73]UIJ33591.1 NADP-dependent oxidoreductase [Allobranchiibius sp. GilTou73]